MNIFAAKAERLGVIGVVLLARLDAAGADDITLGKPEVDVVSAEVGKELGVIVILMTVPRAVPKDADLGKPLGPHDEISLISGSGSGEWELVVKGDVEANHLLRRQRFGEGDFHHRMVVLIAIVGGSEAHVLGEIPIALERDALDLDGALLLLLR